VTISRTHGSAGVRARFAAAAPDYQCPCQRASPAASADLIGSSAHCGMSAHPYGFSRALLRFVAAVVCMVATVVRGLMRLDSRDLRSIQTGRRLLGLSGSC
jgi:hypothetical protein